MKNPPVEAGPFPRADRERTGGRDSSGQSLGVRFRERSHARSRLDVRGVKDGPSAEKGEFRNGPEVGQGGQGKLTRDPIGRKGCKLHIAGQTPMALTKL